MSQNTLEKQLAAGIRAAQQGNAERARELLEGVLRRDRNNEQAWIWLTSVVKSDKERRLCLERVLRINPANKPAQTALNNMVGVLGGGDSTIDVHAISQAAKTPIPTGRSREDTSRSANAQTSRSGQTQGGRNRMVPILMGIALLLGLLLIGSLLLPQFLQGDDIGATETTIAELVTAEVTAEITATVDPFFTPPTSTIVPSPTFSGTLVTSAATLPPTFTPTPSLTPSQTALPTATLPPRQDYQFLILGVQRFGQPDLYRLNGDGAGLLPLISGVSDIDYNVATQRIAFVRSEGGSNAPTRLYHSFANDTELQGEVVSEAFESASSPAISPNGDYIAFTGRTGTSSDIYLYSIVSNTMTQITDSDSFNDQDPAWSPDGTLLVFASERETPGRNELYSINPFEKDAQATRITNSRGNNILPDWSPTSDEIVYLNVNSDRTIVRITDTEGSFARDLTFEPDWLYSAPTWTSDGNYIIYTARDLESDLSEIYFMTPATRDVQSFGIVDIDIVMIVSQ